MSTKADADWSFDAYPYGPRRGGWQQLGGGRRWWPLDPRPQDVFIDDIAESLSKTVRYNGHGQGFYSVAEHSVLCSQVAPPELQLEALLHDAHEAYTGDLSRPNKLALRAAARALNPASEVSDYDYVETLAERAVRARFGLPLTMTPAVKEIDNRITADERAVLFPLSPGSRNYEPLGVRIVRWGPAQARLAFLNRYLWLTHGRAHRAVAR